MMNLQRPIINITIKKVNIKFFSCTANKYMQSDLMKKIDTLLEKSKAFEKQVKNTTDIIQEKNKMSKLKQEE